MLEREGITSGAMNLHLLDPQPLRIDFAELADGHGQAHPQVPVNNPSVPDQYVEVRPTSNVQRVQPAMPGNEGRDKSDHFVSIGRR